MMSGLSPDALCRLRIFTRRIRISNTKSDIHFDAIKICYWWHGMHETFTNVHFPPITLIKLYEFLRNSRSIKKS